VLISLDELNPPFQPTMDLKSHNYSKLANKSWKYGMLSTNQNCVSHREILPIFLELLQFFFQAWKH